MYFRNFYMKSSLSYIKKNLEYFFFTLWYLVHLFLNYIYFFINFIIKTCFYLNIYGRLYLKYLLNIK